MAMIAIVIVQGIAAAQTRPNILVILVDDMGFSDLGCYGGEIQTPNLNRLAADGLRFTQFHNCARCCPTRASLLTGLYAHQVGLRYNGRSLNRKGITIAEALKGVGMSKAEAIVSYRDKNGQFKHIDELVNVKGIGIRTVDINREYILLDNSELAARK